MTVYLVFAGQICYPTGADDLKGVFASKETAQKLCDSLSKSAYDWKEVVEEEVIFGKPTSAMPV